MPKAMSRRIVSRDRSGMAVLSMAAAVLASASLADGVEQPERLFLPEAVVGDLDIVDCTLSGGTETQCIAITVKGDPVDHPIGPWCPGSITDTADAGGIWLENDEVHDVDGAFIRDLAAFYDDPVWSMFDPASGEIKVTTTEEGCRAAARPNVDPAYYNYCVECQLDYMDHSTRRTYVLPLEPVKAASPSPLFPHSGTGVALNGVRMDAPAPTGAILGAHTLAPFDDCGGHVNLHVGYHYHAATGCSAEIEAEDGHAAMIGLAMDGYPLHARLNGDGAEPLDLDACRGHETAALGYHYHVDAPGKNAILPCHTGETGCANAGDETACDATERPRRPRP